jgi:hypothetical protein
MRKKNADLPQRRALLRKCKIKYAEERPSRSRHSYIFGDIQILGSTDLKTYSANVTVEAQQKPRRATVLKRAATAVEKSRLRPQDNDNEQTWRTDLENDILARFSVEVTW